MTRFGVALAAASLVLVAADASLKDAVEDVVNMQPQERIEMVDVIADRVVVSLPKALKTSAMSQMNMVDDHYVNSGFFFFLGCFMLWKADKVWNWTVTILTFYWVYFLSMDQLEQYEGGDSVLVRQWEALLMALVAAYAARKSTMGNTMLAAALLGWYFAASVEDGIKRTGYTADNSYGYCGFYTVCVTGFVWLAQSQYWLQMVALLSTFFGSNFVVTALQYWYAITLRGEYEKVSYGAYQNLLWDDKLSSPDVGYLAGQTSYTTIFGAKVEFCPDRAWGVSLWYLLFTIAFCCQLGNLKENQKVAA